MSIAVRPAQTSDAAAIAELVTQLGYPATKEAIVERLRHFHGDDSVIALIAELDGRVAGVITGHVIRSIHAMPPVAWLTTLVVHSSAHNRGVGRALTKTVETWARERGAEKISLTSGLHRAAAHEFYEHIGYVRSGLRLTRDLI